MLCTSLKGPGPLRVETVMERYVCIHGHFYQPPRENPWLEEVELQDSAYPFHDWNERITEECYWPNAVSRILGTDKKIIDIVNNYTHISFDFGPTLLAWLERHEPQLYNAILEADKQSQDLFGGHGSALAQAYNHMIMPLANGRDKRTQIAWGIRDFEERFERSPEGLWLPETAVDLETLDIMAEYGIRFTILSPLQALKVSPLGAQDWTVADKEKINTTRPYLCRLPSGRSIALFFYHGPTAQGVASGHLIQNGEVFTEALLSILKDGDAPQGLAHIATDGETFGHHHRYTDMALAYGLHLIEAKRLAKVTVYGQYLEKFPPTWEVQIRENTSWSCQHGVERWQDNCGCSFEKSMTGKQAWRRPLRRALDDLQGRLAGLYESQMARFCQDPWAVRNAYIALVNDRASENIDGFVIEQTGRDLPDDDKVRFLKLLEMQRNAMLMYTSCAWYFDDIAGIEAVQVLHYACRAIQLARELDGQDLEQAFEAGLEQAPAHAKGLANGREVYRRLVKPNRADLNRVAAHLAVSAIFEPCPPRMDFYCYSADIESCERHEAGLQALSTGRATITSTLVLEHRTADFAVYRFSEQDVIAAVGGPLPEPAFTAMQEGLREAFDKGDTTEIIRLMNLTFGGNHYSLGHLFKDQQRRIVYQLLDTTWQEIEVAYRQIYQRNFTIMHLMRGMGIPLPKALAAAAEFVINQDLLKAILSEPVDVERLKDLMDEAARLSVPLDQQTLQFEAGHKINGLMDRLDEAPEDVVLLETVEATLRILSTVVAGPNVQAGQNILFGLRKTLYPEKQRQADAGDGRAETWLRLFREIAQHLGMGVE
jgi:alpha-amylase/alpha-mannosidase (GH57 family)